MNLQEMPRGDEAPVPATGRSLFTHQFNYIVIISVVIIAVFAVFLGERRREI